MQIKETEKNQLVIEIRSSLLNHKIAMLQIKILSTRATINFGRSIRRRRISPILKNYIKEDKKNPKDLQMESLELAIWLSRKEA